jgi:hypothetical protein
VLTNNNPSTPLPKKKQEKGNPKFNFPFISYNCSVVSYLDSNETHIKTKTTTSHFGFSKTNLLGIKN